MIEVSRMSAGSRILEYTAQIQALLDKINSEAAMGEFKTPEVPKESKVFSQECAGFAKEIIRVSPGLSEIQLLKLAQDEVAKAAGLLTLEAGLHLVASNLGFEVGGDGKLARKVPAVESAAPVKSELEKDGVDFNLVDYLDYGMVVKGKKYIESETWKAYDKVLYAAGYKYSTEEKAWIFQPHTTKTEKQAQKAATPKDRASKVVRISDLTQDLKNPTITGKLLDDPVQRDVNTSKGPASVTSFRIDDGSAVARVSLWDEKGNEAMQLVPGDEVQLTSLMVREPFDGLPQVSGGKWTKITKL